MKIIIIDDDPTGSQTVNDCNLILRWDYETLLKGLKDSSNLLFILANTRSLYKKDVKSRLKEILSISTKEYFEKIDKDKSFVMEFKKPLGAIQEIKKEIKKYLA